MTKSQAKILKEIAARISSFPYPYVERKIKIAPLLGMLIGLGVGFYADLLFLNYLAGVKIPNSYIDYLLKNYNSLYYPRSGPVWFNILAFPLLGAVVGFILGQIVEKSFNKRSR